jgi:hypothetical protein
MSKHTPGPWGVEFSEPYEPEITAGQWSICRVAAFAGYGEIDLGNELGGNNESLANARLIAAAPELLAALSHLVALLEPVEQWGALAVPGLATLNEARAAIAKATT